MALQLPPHSSNWEAVGDAFYRKEEIYRMSWSVMDLSFYKVVGAPFAGPIAMTLDTSKPIPVLDTVSSMPSTTRPRIHVYSSSGQLIHTVVWDHPSSLVCFGFTSAETLVTVSSMGFYRLYPISSNASTPADLPPYSQHTLGSTTEEIGVLDAIIWSDGMVAMRSDLTFVQIKGWPELPPSEINPPADIQVRTSTSTAPNHVDTFSTLPSSANQHVLNLDRSNGKRESFDTGVLTERPAAWSVIPPHSSSTGVIQILASRQDSIVVIDPMDSTDQRLSAKGPFLRIVPSPNGKFLALMTGPNSSKPYTVWVVSSDFLRELSEFSLVEQTGEEFLSSGPPTRMVWCGGDTVVIAWEKSLLMIGPFGASLRYTFNESIHLVSEIDGIRIFTLNSCEFLSKVASCTSMIFTPGSTSPAAILFDAMDQFNKHSARVADEHIRNITKKLTEAVTGCIQAAGQEFEPRWQQRLMKAAAFGKIFLDVYNPEPFVQMSKTLRVLNAVRNYKIGIPLTYEQYISHHPDHLISRLTARSHHLLALRLTEFLNLSPAAVLRHWARNVILNMSSADLSKQEASSAAICRRIVSKLGDRHGVSPADIAEIAWSLGKTKLCTELLAHELKPKKQIPLLMSMDQGRQALDQSIKSLDPDLIQTVLWEIRARKPLAEFLSVVEGKEEAINTLRLWARAGVERDLTSETLAKSINVGPDWELYRDFCYQDDRRTESASLCLEESCLLFCPTKTYTPSSLTEWEDFFSTKIEKVKEAIKYFSEDSERVFEQSMTSESVRLLTFQKTLIMDILKSWETNGTNNPTQDQLKRNFIDAMAAHKGLIMPSLNETIRQCIKLGLRRQADKLKIDFKVHEKRFWYVKMKALVELKDWEGLESWSGKKSPIGFEPFVTHLLAMGCHREAIRYVPKCEAQNRVELYVKCGEWVTAGEECADRGETAKLIELRQRCPSPHVVAILSKMIEDLAA